MRRRRGLAASCSTAIGAECNCLPSQRRERGCDTTVGDASRGVRSPPHLASVPRRRAHIGDGRGWAPLRSMR